MSNGMPELGSKISLISKADIRYEGRLFTVDPHECTIALATVRSFGTEDRETQFPVAPQNQVYDYILFRGTDIKDIRVVNNSVNALPNDPAIMQLSVPASLGQPNYQPQAFAHPVLGAAMGPPMAQYGAPYGSMGLPPNIAPGMGNRAPPKQINSVLELLSGASRSGTPVNLQNVARKSPTMDQSVQVSPMMQPSGAKPRTQQNIPRGQNQNRERRESRGERADIVNSTDRPNSQNKGNAVPRQHQPQHPNQGQHPNQVHPGQGQQPGQGQNTGQIQHPGQAHLSQRGNWGGRPNMRQRGRGRGALPGNFRPPPPTGMQTAGNAQRLKNTLKFDNDYDFEQANTEFEELRSQLAKVKVADEIKTDVNPLTEIELQVVPANGEVDKKDDSGNETGAGEPEPEDDGENCYDKTKSFFDNISCEAVERSKGRSQRTDWRTERKLNSETFGVSSARRGGYRGRGGFYNRGMGGNMYHRGGFHRGGGFRGNRARGGGGHQNIQQPQPQQQQQPSRPQAVAAAAGK